MCATLIYYRVWKETTTCKMLSNFVIPSNSDTFSDWRRTCHVSWVETHNSQGRTKLTNSLGKQQLELLTRTWSGHDLWNHSKFVSQPASNKRFLCSFFFFFWVGRYNKTLNDWSCRKRRVLFPLYLNVPQGEAKGNTEGLRETKLTVSLGLVIKFL